jgi:DNA polymerase III subunit epsilon
MTLLSRYRTLLFHRSAREHRVSQPAFDPETPIAEVPYSVLDTELTGLKPRQDSIVSIAALRIRGGSILVGEHFSQVVQPRTALNGASIVIHGITHSDTHAAPTFQSILPAFLDFVRGTALVGHALSIDLAFLNQEMAQHSLEKLLHPALDTMAIEAFLKKRTGDRCAFNDGDHGRLDLVSLARERGITMYRAHDAMSDAYVTAQVFQRHLAMLPQHGVRTIGQLIAIGKP